jgi:hypothetical protein
MMLLERSKITFLCDLCSTALRLLLFSYSKDLLYFVSGLLSLKILYSGILFLAS